MNFTVYKWSYLFNSIRYGRTDVRTYADVRTKISRINRLPDLLTNGAPLSGFRPQRSSAIRPACSTVIVWNIESKELFSSMMIRINNDRIINRITYNNTNNNDTDTDTDN